MTRACAIPLSLIALASLPLAGKTQKGDEYLKEGAQAELKQDYESALQLYDYALEEDSHEAAYVAADQRARRLRSRQIVERGKALVDIRKLREAMVQFQVALSIDPHSQSAQDEIRKIEKQVAALPAPVILEPVDDLITRLTIDAQSPRAVYENIGKQAGIKVTFDSMVVDSREGEKGDSHAGSISGVSVEDALNYAARVTHTAWKASDAGTIFVTRQSGQKESRPEVAPVPAHTGSSLTLSALTPDDALRSASRAGKLADVVRLVLTGADVNAPDMLGMTPLLCAAAGDDPEIVLFLLRHGGDENIRGRGQLSVLHAAVSHGNAKIVELLLVAHADQEALNADGKTPLDDAALAGRTDIVRLLLLHGADVKNAHFLDERGLLHEICAKGSANLIPLLVGFGADPAQRDRFGETPLDLALANKNETAVAELLRLAKQRAQLQATAEEAMEAAIVHGYTEIARTLLENGFDLHKPTANGSTYLADAALKGQKSVVRLLLDHGANLAARNKFGGMALHDAALGGSAEVINLLLDHGAEIDARNLEIGATPLMLAASMGRGEAVAALLKRGANVQLRDSSGHTALDRAKEAGNTGIIGMLGEKSQDSIAK